MQKATIVFIKHSQIAKILKKIIKKKNKLKFNMNNYLKNGEMMMKTGFKIYF